MIVLTAAECPQGHRGGTTTLQTCVETRVNDTSGDLLEIRNYIRRPL